MKRLVYIVLAALCLGCICASAAVPRKKAFVYDGLILSAASRSAVDWDRIAADKKIGYVYFEIPFPASDTAALRQNVLAAQARGLKTGMCFTFTDSLQKVSAVLDHLGSVARELSEVSPMISIPEGGSFERRTLHRWIQVWANVINRRYGEQPVLKANREDCKDYLAPVLTSTYRICLVFTEPAGSYMLQSPERYKSEEPGLVAYPCRVMPE